MFNEPVAAQMPTPPAARRVQGLGFSGAMEGEFRAFARDTQAPARRQAQLWLQTMLLTLVVAAVLAGAKWGNALVAVLGKALASPQAWLGLQVLGMLLIFFPTGRSFGSRLVAAALFGMAATVAQVFIWPDAGWPQHLLAGLCWLATLLLAALGAYQHEQTLRALFLMQQTVTQLASTDALTGLCNRHAFEPYVARTMQHAARGQQQVALVLVDVDRFRPYNDQHGRAAGDVALRALGRAVSLRIRRQFDLGARLGGEEFALFLHDVDLGYAWAVAEELRRDVEQRLALAQADSPYGVITVSAGLATSAAGETFEQLYQRADRALGLAKAAGGNQVQIAESQAG